LFKSLSRIFISEYGKPTIEKISLNESLNGDGFHILFHFVL